MSKSNQPNWDVIVVGGEAAGSSRRLFACARNQGLRVLIIEKARRTLGKVLISGGGRVM